MKYFKWLFEFPYNIISLVAFFLFLYLSCNLFFVKAFKVVADWFLEAVSYLADPFVLFPVLIVFACCIVRLAGVRSLDSLVQTIKDNARVLMSACLLIALGIVFLLLERLSVDPQDVYLHFDPSDNMISGNFYIDVFSLSDFYNLVGSSFILTGIFSVLLGFTDFVNYVSNRLRSIVITDEYINKLSNDEQKELRYSLDKVMYGEIATGDGSSLYEYLKNDLEVLFYEPYREDLHDSYYYKVELDKKFWTVVNRTTYDLVCTHANRDEKINIYYNGSTQLDLSDAPCNQVVLERVIVSIDNYTYSMGSVTADQMRSGGTYQLTLDNVCSWLESNVDVELTLVPGLFGENFSISVSIPIALSSETRRKIPIGFEFEKLTSAEERYVVLSMGYPTKGACLSCHMDSPQASCYFGGQSYVLNSDRTTVYGQQGHYEMKINDWLFPGHGAVVAWQLQPVTNQENCDATVA